MFLEYNCFSDQMFDGSNRVIDNHSWSRPSHHHSDSFFHLWFIAMHGALFACGLLLAKTASVKSAEGIVKQLLAIGAQFGITFMLTAIQAYHLFHHSFFFLNARVSLVKLIKLPFYVWNCCFHSFCSMFVNASIDGIFAPLLLAS